MHFRIQRLRDSRDDEALIVPVREWEPWLCECGTTNTDGGARCAFCNEPRDSYVCDCGHRNPAGATECEECGKPKAEE